MSNIEEKFFETFEIKPELTFYDLIRLKEDTGQEFGGRCGANWHGETKEETIRRFSPKGWKVLECKDVYTYPQITDRILLKLICLMGNTDYFLITNEGLPINIKGLKDSVLHSLTIYSKFHKGLKEEVQAIFKEQ